MLPILLALVFIALLIVIVITGQPDEFAVTRRIKINAPAGSVYPQVNELRNWEAWSPWARLDPNCKMVYDGPPGGVGASYSWSGSNKVGVGRSTVTQSVPNELVRFRLEFQKPMVATNTVEFTFRSDDGQTTVAWAMSGKNNLAGKIFGLFVNCEKMCGKQFDQGLAQMKSVVEGAGMPRR
ncbi:MAG TPA: SRPBCC family protein [Pseudomonadales bacterium]|nr:SRPBCC family protein [Pseudomonadales bacterium]